MGQVTYSGRRSGTSLDQSTLRTNLVTFQHSPRNCHLLTAKFPAAHIALCNMKQNRGSIFVTRNHMTLFPYLGFISDFWANQSRGIFLVQMFQIAQVLWGSVEVSQHLHAAYCQA